MKILFVYPKARTGWYKEYLKGETPSTILYGFPELKNLGFDVEFSDRAYSAFNFIKWLLLPLQKLIISKTGIGFKLDQAILLFRKAQKADIVITTSDSTGLPFALLKYLGLLKTPLFYTTIGLGGQFYTFGNNWVFSFYRKILPAADKIIVYSRSEINILKKSFKISDDKLLLLPIGVDTNFFYPKHKSLDYILAAGRDLGRDYGPYFKVAEASPKFTFKVICSARNLVGLKVPKNVKTEMNVNYQTLRNNYWHSKLVVLPLIETQRASGQTVLLEAMACGKCVVVSMVKGLSEVYALQSHKNCIFTPVGSVPSLKKKILMLIEDPFYCKKIGKQARKLVESRYSQKKYGESLAREINHFFEG